MSTASLSADPRLRAGAERIERAIARARQQGRLALCAFLTAGYPSKNEFEDLLPALCAVADVVEVGVPFSDPMADGLTIQRSSRAALAAGVTLPWILEVLAAGAGEPASAPRVLMSYLNPLLAPGFELLAGQARSAGVDGFVVPDLPLEEDPAFDGALARNGLAQIQLVSPATPPARRSSLAARSGGFLYAVTVRGTTGGSIGAPPQTLDYLDRVRRVSPVPVLAGFGVREPAQARLLGTRVDGIVVGSALIERIESGADPLDLLRHLREVPREREGSR